MATTVKRFVYISREYSFARFDDYIEEGEKLEETINCLDKRIHDYLVKLMITDLDAKQSNKLSKPIKINSEYSTHFDKKKKYDKCLIDFKGKSSIDLIIFFSMFSFVCVHTMCVLLLFICNIFLLQIWYDVKMTSFYGIVAICYGAQKWKCLMQKFM